MPPYYRHSFIRVTHSLLLIHTLSFCVCVCYIAEIRTPQLVTFKVFCDSRVPDPPYCACMCAVCVYYYHAPYGETRHQQIKKQCYYFYYYFYYYCCCYYYNYYYLHFPFMSKATGNLLLLLLGVLHNHIIFLPPL